MSRHRASKASRLVENATEQFRMGSCEQAKALCGQALSADANHSGALDLLGLVEFKSGNQDRAIELISRAIALDPSFSDAHAHLGDVYLEIERLDEARACYQAAIEADARHAAAHNSLGVILARQRCTGEAIASFHRALAIEPDWPVPHFNLGLALKEQSQIAGAAREFRCAWVQDPIMSSAMYECVSTVAAWAREDPSFRTTSLPNPEPQGCKISVVFCSIDETKLDRTRKLYQRLLGSVPHELVPIRDARSLAEAYNRGVALSTGDVVILSHDDIDVLSDDFASRLQDLMAQFDVVGVMGATEMSGPTWNWSRHPHLRGWITHRESDHDTWRVLPVDPRAVAGEVVVLDGVFVAARRRVLEEVRFDEDTFNGFHLYDIDWSYRAAEAGFRLAAAGDLLLVHASRGRYDDTWQRYARRFCAKHLGGDPDPPSPLHIAEADLGSADEVRAFFGRLVAMDAESRIDP